MSYDKIIINIFKIVTLLICLIFFIRFYNSITLSDISHVLTSGYEEESLLEIWYNIHGREMYVDHLKFPYRWTLYNWMFYDFYSLTYKFISHLFSLDIIWLPTVLRLLTFSSTIILMFIVYKTNKILNSNSRLHLYFSLVLIFGLSFGYWSITVRPDLLSVLFEIFAIYIFLKNNRNPNLSNLVFLTVILYFAWSFKQTALISFCTILIYFLINLKIKKFFIISSIFFSLIFFTVLLQNSNYLNTIYFIGTNYPFKIETLINNSLKLIVKNLVLFSSLLLIIYFKIIRFNFKIIHKNLSSINIFLFIGFFVSIVYFFGVNMNAGSSDNHTFTLLIFLNFLIIYNEKSIFENLLSKRIIIISLISYIIICILILTGNLGRLAPKKYENISNYMECIKITNKSTFVDINFYRLPWITNYSNPSVETYNYKFELKSNRLEHGGHEGLIKNGYYDYLVLFNKHNYNLNKYSLKKECENFDIYKRTLN